jgi:hypothetical protein
MASSSSSGISRISKNFGVNLDKLSLQPGLENLEEASGILVKMAHDLTGWTERETHKDSDYWQDSLHKIRACAIGG